METSTELLRGPEWAGFDLTTEPAFTDRFELLGEVGRGGMGIVYRARHRYLDREVAVKVMRTGGSAERFAREARLLAKVRSPYVVAVHDVQLLPGGFPLLVMEWVEGSNLSDLIAAAGAIPEVRVLPWMWHTCEGMLAVAEHGIIHRDLKPSNLLIDSQGQARVADFGLARGPAAADQLSRSSLVMDTAMYMAPEQADDPRGVDTRADIYSFGATFYHALTGRSPFTGRTALSLLIKHKTEPPTPLRAIRSDLTSRVCSVLERCLSKIPSDRFSSFSELLGELKSDRSAPTQPPAGAADPARVLGTALQSSPASRVAGVDHARSILEFAIGIAASLSAGGKGHPNFWRGRTEARELLSSSLGESSNALRRKRLQPLTEQLLTVLSQLDRRDYEKRKAVHLELATGFAALDELILRERHLNCACDCVVTQVITTPEGPGRVELERQRDQLYEIIVRRESFQKA